MAVEQADTTTHRYETLIGQVALRTTRTRNGFTGLGRLWRVHVSPASASRSLLRLPGTLVDARLHRAGRRPIASWKALATTRMQPSSRFVQRRFEHVTDLVDHCLFRRGVVARDLGHVQVPYRNGGAKAPTQAQCPVCDFIGQVATA